MYCYVILRNTLLSYQRLNLANKIFTMGFNYKTNIIIFICINKHFCQKRLISWMEMYFWFFYGNC